MTVRNLADELRDELTTRGLTTATVIVDRLQDDVTRAEVVFADGLGITVRTLGAKTPRQYADDIADMVTRHRGRP